jgi:hypothetical protein
VDRGSFFLRRNGEYDFCRECAGNPGGFVVDRMARMAPLELPLSPASPSIPEDESQPEEACPTKHNIGRQGSRGKKHKYKPLFSPVAADRPPPASETVAADQPDPASENSAEIKPFHEHCPHGDMLTANPFPFWAVRPCPNCGERACVICTRAMAQSTVCHDAEWYEDYPIPFCPECVVTRREVVVDAQDRKEVLRPLREVPRFYLDDALRVLQSQNSAAGSPAGAEEEAQQEKESTAEEAAAAAEEAEAAADQAGAEEDALVIDDAFMNRFVNKHKLWAKLPSFAERKLQSIMGPLLKRYTDAPQQDRSNILQAILLVPSSALIKRPSPKGRNAKKDKRSQQQLASQLNHAAKFFADLDWEAADARDIRRAAHEYARQTESWFASKMKGSDPDDDIEDDERSQPGEVEEPDTVAPVTQEELDNSAKVSAAVALVRQGFLAKAARLLNSSGLLDITPEVMAKLKALHPEPPDGHETQPPPETAEPMVVDSDMLKGLIHRHGMDGSSGGVSGWMSTHLLALIQDHVCMQGITDIVQDIMADKVDTVSRLLLLQSMGLAARKSEDHDDPRPIAIGEIFYRLAAAYAVSAMGPTLAAIFENIQFSVGIKGGSQQAFHTIMADMERCAFHGLSVEGTEHDDLAVAMFDVPNAFNIMQREAMFKTLYNHPELSPMYHLSHFAYGHDIEGDRAPWPDIVYRLSDGSTLRLKSHNGVRQGCGLGTALFCLDLHPKLIQAMEGLELTVRAVSDDITAVGPLPHLLLFAERLREQGVVLHPAKSFIYWFDGAYLDEDGQQKRFPHCEGHGKEPTPAQLRSIKDAGLVCHVGSGAKSLGSYLHLGDGRDASFQNAVIHATTKAEGIRKILKLMAHPDMPMQVRTALLISCVHPRLSFLARVQPPEVTVEAFKEADRLIHNWAWTHTLALPEERETPIDDITFTDSPPAVSEQLSLPRRLGGEGLRLYANIAHHAYFAQAVATSRLTTPPPSHPLFPDNELPFMRRRRQALETLRDTTSDEIVSNLGLVGGLQKPEDHFHPSKNVTDDDCFLLPLTNADKDIIDFYGVSEDPNVPVPKLQNVLVNADDDLKVGTIMDGLSKPDKARFLSLRGKGASAFYNSCDGEFAVRCAHWQHGRRVRFGLPAALGVFSCQCGKDLRGALTDREHEDTEHALSCYTLNAAKTRRHDGLVGTISKFCHEGAIPTTIEPRPPSGVDRKRPDTAHNFTGKEVVTDVTVPHPSAKSYVRWGSWKEEGQTAKLAHQKKNDKYRALAVREGVTMMPLAIETYGWAHPGVHAFLKLVAKETVDAGLSDQSAGAFPTPKIMIGRHYAYLLKRLSVTLLKGNAEAVIDFARKANKSARPKHAHRPQSWE